MAGHSAAAPLSHHHVANGGSKAARDVVCFGGKRFWGVIDSHAPCDHAAALVAYRFVA